MRLWELLLPPSLTPSQMQDLRLAASKMTGAARRAFQAEMTLKYCHGSARFAETLLGWSRDAVEVGLAERRTGIICLGGHAAWSGRKRWEVKYPEAAAALRTVAEAHAQQDPTFRTTLAYTRLTAKAARAVLKDHGIPEARAVQVRFHSQRMGDLGDLDQIFHRPGDAAAHVGGVLNGK